ncbi:response regulator [Paenibacillus psychroresistens]|nr:response regulator [Paenibacillus psychroresistens]
MYNVIIIDDEPKVRKGLGNLIPMLDAEWSVIGEAKNGLEGIELVKSLSPDLVITDIRMPKMNGLDLLNQLRGYPVLVVILSGYGYFEYAQTAIKFGAFEYLLKPIKPMEIQDMLLRIKQSIRMQRGSKQLSELKLDCSTLWKEWLLEEPIAAEPSQRLEELYQVKASFRILIIEIDEIDELILKDRWGDRRLVFFAVRNIVEDIIREEQASECSFMFQHGAQLSYFFMDYPNEQEISLKIIAAIKSWLKFSVSIGISEVHTRLRDTPLAWKQAQEATQNKWIHGQGSVCLYSHFQVEELIAIGYPLALEQALVGAVISGQEEQALERLYTFLDEISTAPAMTFRLFRRFSLQLAAAILRLLYEHKVSDLVMRELSQPADFLESGSTIPKLRVGLTGLIRSSVNSLRWLKEQKNHQTLEPVLEYVQRNYMKDISLEEAVQIAQMSTSYFCAFFRQEVGVTFVEHLTRVRMEKSRQLMIHEDLKLYEIAKMVGYQDVKYFSRVFKRSHNISPAEYRQFFFQKEVEA